MFPISIKIVVEEDAVDFGLHLTVPDKHSLPISPHFINDQSPRPNAQMEKRKKERGRSYGSREEEG